MARVSLDLDNRDDLARVGASGWRRSMGMVPGEPNQGLVAEMRGVAARLIDYDDSAWEQPESIQERLSAGFTFAWYRLAFTMPDNVKGQSVAGNRVFFECNVDNYGEVYVDGAIDRDIGVITGNNTAKRVPVTGAAEPGSQHLLAVLVANAPLGDPVGSIFFRHATLAFEEAPPR